MGVLAISVIRPDLSSIDIDGVNQTLKVNYSNFKSEPIAVEK
jgi:hypothetical protein